MDLIWIPSCYHQSTLFKRAYWPTTWQVRQAWSKLRRISMSSLQVKVISMQVRIWICSKIKIRPLSSKLDHLLYSHSDIDKVTLYLDDLNRQISVEKHQQSMTNKSIDLYNIESNSNPVGVNKNRDQPRPKNSQNSYKESSYRHQELNKYFYRYLKTSHIWVDLKRLWIW